MSPDEDEAWIAGIRRGDVAAFEATVRGYGPQLAAFARSLLGAPDDAEDVVQESLWRIWDRRQAWQPTVSLRAYLLTAVRNRALNVLAHRRVQAAHQATDGAGAVPEGTVDAVVAAEEAIARQRALARGLATLTEKQRTAVRLRYSDGLSMADVAAVLGVSVSAAERLVARALGVLRAEAARAGGT
jgi:RNA polymerase sigma-70 factor (ECF subfamily)